MKKKYPGRRTLAEWQAMSVGDRNLAVTKAQSALLGFWSECANKRCRRARSCMGYSFTCYHHWRDRQTPAKRKRADARCAHLQRFGA